MQANLIAYLPSPVSSCWAPSRRESQAPSRGDRGFSDEATADCGFAGPDAYKVAVLLLAGATILTLF